ncbi:MAG: hypothetical protein VSS75_024640 [Candidatus Parabeggiatoa sp.]|nr:hypothetical protein [Candidatus Parabeggiatoa sp.]
MFRIITLTSCLFLLLPVLLQAETQPELNINPAILSALSQPVIINNLPLNSSVNYTSTEFQKEFSDLLTAYQKEIKASHDLVHSQRTAVNLFSTLISGASSLSLPPALSIPVIVATTAVQEMINAKITQFDNSMKKRASNAVKTKLSKLSANVKPEAWVNEHFKAELEQVPSELLPEVNQYLIEAVKRQLQKTDNTLKAHLLENQDAIQDLKTTDQQFESDIEILTQGIQVQRKYQKKLNAKLETIKTTQGELINDLNEFQKITTDNLEQNRDAIQQNRFKITENADNISGLARQALMNMNPKEQLAALDHSIFAKAVTEQEKAAIQIQARQQHTLEEIQGFASDLGSIAVIANNIGLPSQITQPLNKITSVVTSVVTSIALFESGKILGGIAALTSIFKIDQKSAEEMMMENQQKMMKSIKDILDGQQVLAANQKHIMKGIAGLFKGQKTIVNNQALIIEGVKDILEGQGILAENQTRIIDGINGLYEGQQAILTNQQSLFENQKQITENQKQITQTIIEVGNTLAKQIQANQKHIFNRFDRLERNQAFLATLNRWQIIDDFNACERIQRLLQTEFPDTILNKRTFNLNEASQYIDHVINANHLINQKWQNCKTGMIDLISIADELHIAYQLKSVIGNKDNPSRDIQTFIEQFYIPVLKILLANLNSINLNNGQELVQALYNPAFTTKSLIEKQETISAWRIKKYQKRLKNKWLKLMEHPLHSQTLIKDAKRILNVFPLLDADNGTGQVRFHPVQNLDLTTSSGYEIINELAILIDFAIAMETLASGDILLPILDTVLWQQNQTEAVLNILKHNPMLANNFILYSLQKYLVAPSTVVGYAYAYKITDNINPMKEVFKNPLKGKIHFKQDKWLLIIGDHPFSMPEPDILMQGKLVYFPSLYELLELRKQIAQIIFDYKFFMTKLKPSQKKLLADMLQ